jgi:hypothetical protein
MTKASERKADYSVIGQRETSPRHYVIIIKCDCAHRFTRRPMRLWSRGWTRCPRCKAKLIRKVYDVS